MRVLTRQLANQQLKLKSRSGLRSLDREVGGGGELKTARDLFSVLRCKSGDVGVPFEWRHRDVAETSSRPPRISKMFPEASR
jgi:hypothetical protein